ERSAHAATADIDALSLHDALPIFRRDRAVAPGAAAGALPGTGAPARPRDLGHPAAGEEALGADGAAGPVPPARDGQDLRCAGARSEEHTSELQSRENLVCRLLLEK